MARFKKHLPDGECQKGYLDGMRDSLEHNELSAYYAGVGYGKKLAGDKNIGFNSQEEREQFERGVARKDKHFNSYRAEPMSFFERLFGGKKKKDKPHIQYDISLRRKKKNPQGSKKK